MRFLNGDLLYPTEIQMKFRLLKLALPVIALLALGPSHAFANLITNPGFETGDFTGWTLSGTDTADIIVTTNDPLDGTYVAQLGSVGGQGYLSQTVAVTPGQKYDISFWLLHDNGLEPSTSNWSVSFGGTTLDSHTNVGQFDYTQFSYTGVAGGTGLFQFGAQTNIGWFRLDDISVTAESSVPDGGSTAAMLGLALVGLAFFRRKKLR